MKVTAHYQEPEDPDLHLTLRITLPRKFFATKTLGHFLELFVAHYNTKFADRESGFRPLEVERLILREAGKGVAPNATKVEEAWTGTSVVVFIVDVGCLDAHLERQRAVAQQVIDGATPATASAPTQQAQQAQSPPATPKQLRCRRFGCNKYFDASADAEAECRHHVSPPVFHETAKFWSCCQHAKAWDWESFQAIAGCHRSVGHSTEKQEGKQFLGGCDIREDCAPQRLDGDGNVVLEPRKRLEGLRRACECLGVDVSLYDKVWGKLAAQYGDLGVVADKFRAAIERELRLDESDDMDRVE